MIRYRISTVAIVLALISFACKREEKKDIEAELPTLAKPSKKQIEFADWEVGAFFHFGLNVFTGQEHGDGKESPSRFNPTELDAEQWVLTAKSMGAKYGCLTVRHEGGFCLWPSKTTDYTIANSPYKDGKGDLAQEFVDACRKHGLKIGFYHTGSHDAHEGLSWYDGYIGWADNRDSLMTVAFRNKERKEKYKQVQLDQMRELLTNYGPIDFMWSDHWGAPGSEFIWNPMTDLVAELQPNMVFMGPETWVPGNESGHVVYPMWNAVNTVDGTKYTRPAPNTNDSIVANDYGLLENEVRTGHPLGKYWRVRECTTHWAFHKGGWFWHPDVTLPFPLSKHVDLYYRTVGLGANTIINLPPDNRGLVPDTIAVAAKRFGDEIRKRFSNPIAELNEVQKSDIVELEWVEPKEINTVVLMENIVNGQRIAKYNLEAFVNGKWQDLKHVNYFPSAKKPYNKTPGYETIGHKKIDRVEPVTTNKIRFKCLKSVSGTAEIRRIQVFNCEPYDTLK
ncbi:alpha-L-fucosidase [Tamlana fucoidanivorans]|uniref:alpha-L-fucosidase n=1 Tax=Allotamlana fucoidanivorans TaxID=2583814 RepID=A0A5C4SE02_9FLAO|nr:alpha-L-fucosidase [Tamlana fucoidanivorans]TNJ41500.1 alpha-L-fucosidase [Tamlana fucoidanivorans]